MLKKAILLAVLLLTARPVDAAEYYVSPTGSDSDGGSVQYPFATIGKAVSIAAAGDTIYLRGGQHSYSSKISLSKSGSPQTWIKLQGYPGETPVIDFSGTSTGTRGIELKGDWWYLSNFTIQNAGDNGLYVEGRDNIIECIVARWNEDSGIQLHTGAANNLVYNCDSYENYDPAKNGENADGFAAKFGLGMGNILYGCRAWSNSDDGYDCWNNGDSQSVSFIHCWAFQNGINIWSDTAFAGDGNGFKLGAGAGAHRLIGCVAYGNPHHGIDVNGNTTGVHVYNCTCVQNGGRNFYFDEHSSAHVLRNNVSYLAGVNMYAEIDDAFNSWNGFTLADSDFSSLDPTGLDRPRQADGSLPRLRFLRPVTGSTLIDAGTDVGELFQQAAPDLGAYEWMAGDCFADGVIDRTDLECLAANWLDASCGVCTGADFDGSGGVDLDDFFSLAENWLQAVE